MPSMLRVVGFLSLAVLVPFSRASSPQPPGRLEDPLRTVADVPMPGPAVRFDYQSLDADQGRLYTQESRLSDSMGQWTVESVDGCNPTLLNGGSDRVRHSFSAAHGWSRRFLAHPGRHHRLLLPLRLFFHLLSPLQVRSNAHWTRADWSSSHFSVSALICRISPRACQTSLPANRYTFQRSVATVAVR